MFQVWRLNLKPDIRDANIELKDVLEFCKKNELLGVGWCDVTIRTDNDRELKSEIKRLYQYDKGGGVRALKAMRRMIPNDLIYTRFGGEYYLCRVKSKWIDSVPTDEHKRHGIANFLNVEWSSIETEANVPGKVINTFGPSATV